MQIKEFEKAIKGIDTKKYHICRELGFTENGFEIVKWSIFRRDMSMEEYFSKENLVVLSSEKGDTVKDIKRLIKKGEN